MQIRDKLKSIIICTFGVCASCSTQSVIAEGEFIEFEKPSATNHLTSKEWQQQKTQYKSLKNIDLYVSLDQHQYQVIKPLIDQFAKKKNINIAVDNGTCGISAGLLRKKEADIGGFCCPPGKLDRLPGLEFHTLGLIGLAIIANKSVPVDDLTLNQAREVFNGKMKDWAELSKQQKDIGLALITPIVRPHCNKRPGHWRLLAVNKKSFSQQAVHVGAISDEIKYVADKRGAIGYETLFMLSLYPEKSSIKVLTIDGFHPANVKDIVSGHYPFYRVLNLTTWNGNAHNLMAKDLVAFLNNKTRKRATADFIGVDVLKQHGWMFDHDELIGTPQKNTLHKENMS